MKLSLVFSIICTNCVLAIPNYTYYEITAFNIRERHALHNIRETNKNFIFLNGVTNEASTTMEVVVNSCCVKEFDLLLKKYGLQYNIFASNVILPKNIHITDRTPDVSKTFIDWDCILMWIERKINVNSAFKAIVIAKTYEQRDIYVVKISTAVENENKMAIFIVAGEEGRDWLSSALVLNYINKILESATSPESLLNYYEFYFIPIINPDGFVYSKQEDRFWAKNRKVFQPSRLCSENNAAVGVNIDRNWFFQSGPSMNAICNSIYIGNRPLSEEETRALSYILNKIALNLMAFVNLRGFGNLIALPYADRSEISSNHYVVLEIMKHVSSIINKQYNTSYPVGTTENYFCGRTVCGSTPAAPPITAVLGAAVFQFEGCGKGHRLFHGVPAQFSGVVAHLWPTSDNFSGNMADWVKRNLNIPIVLTLYMNSGKFLPQEDQILPLSNHLDLLLNITLTISRDIYGSLYNKGVNHIFAWILLVLSFNSWIYYG